MTSNVLKGQHLLNGIGVIWEVWYHFFNLETFLQEQSNKGSGSQEVYIE
jgi:hypothetical protein